MAGKEYAVKIPDFRTQAAEETNKAVDQIVKAYREIVADVLGQLRDGNLANEGKVHAIYVLGQLRATAAVTVLIEDIDLKASKFDPKVGLGRWGSYPAQEALSKIGNPAVNMILDRLPGEKDELRRKLMCFVLIDVEGKPFGKLRLKLKYDEETDPAKKKNLELALGIFDMM
jgi:hypothetical protein